VAEAAFIVMQRAETNVRCLANEPPCASDRAQMRD